MTSVTAEHITPVFVKFSVADKYPVTGQIIPILAYIGETVTYPGHIKITDLFDINDTPKITIYRPDNTLDVYQNPMFRIGTGIYQYLYNTAITPITDSQVYDSSVFDTEGVTPSPKPPGIYSAVFRAVNSFHPDFPSTPHILLSKRVVLFNLS